MNTLAEFVQQFSTTSEDDAIQFLTTHFDELPATLQSEYAAFMLSRGLADATHRAEARMRFHEALFAILEVADETDPAPAQ